MLETEELPAGISCLDTCLTHMNRDALSLNREENNNTDGSLDVSQKQKVKQLLLLFLIFDVFDSQND